jgi:hypothetical protein
MGSMLADIAIAVGAACRATGVADVAGVAQAEWAADFKAGGHVRPWRPGRVQRGRAPYLEFRVRDASFTDRTNFGGTANFTVDVAAVVRASNHDDVETKTGGILLTALDAFRSINGAICGASDQIGEAASVPGFSDVWRREASIDLALSYGQGQRGGPIGLVTLPPSSGSTNLAPPGIVTAINWNEAGSPRTVLTIPAGFVVDHVVIVVEIPWDGAAAAVSVGADGDPTAILQLDAIDLSRSESYRVAVPVPAVAVQVAWTPGAGATQGRVTVQVATEPE